MKTRVAVVLPYFGAGGAENMVSRLVSNLDLTELDTEVICIFGEKQNNNLESAIEEHGIPIYYVRKKKGFSLSAVHRLNKELTRFNPDVINTHLSGGFYSSFWIIFHRVKMLHTIHNIPIYEAEKIKRMVYSFLYRTGKAIPIAISKTIRELTEKTYKVKGQVELVYNPVDVKKYSCITKESHDDFVFLMAGRLSKQKNQLIAIEAFKMIVKDNSWVKLIILGEGEERETLERYIKDNGLSSRIFLPGNVNNVEEYMARADAFLLSSDYEGLPLVLLEAMAAKLPIISTDVGGVKDIVGECAILTRPRNVEELANAMKEIMTNADLRVVNSERAFTNVQQYDSSSIAQQYKELYVKYSRKAANI